MRTMLTRLRDERGMGLIELIAAMMVITIALLALMASYDQAFFSLHAAARKTAAASLAETQLELYSAIYVPQKTATSTTLTSTTVTTTQASTFPSIGLSSSLVTAAKASDAFYSTDEASLAPAGTTEVTNASCTTTVAQCEPVQTSVAGSDGKSYRVETFIRDVDQTFTCQGQTTPCTAQERNVTVIVRDPNVSGTPVVYQVTAAFDIGPRS
jgi:Tfp pilus assembly protein PilE